MSTDLNLAVVTVVAGRHRHLRHQHRSLAAGSRVPDQVVVVAMGDPEVAEVVADGPLRTVSTVHHVPAPGELPLARARNRGVAAALEAGADLVVLLDVDCLASPGLLEGYQRAARQRQGLLCGPVAYLPALPAGRTSYDAAQIAAARPHPGRPAPAPGELLPMTDLRLFWSLSFAVDRETWDAVGGFDEEYVGYGGEDTDFGQRAARAGVPGWWVGGAVAHHQWHPVSDPPIEHVAAIVRNANLFRRRWGWFPMEGWLAAFADAGLARRAGDRWEVTP
ncbi:glycosyltransferase family 2 protein [Nocardioides houyundeii]|uniref:glycosyltransferase family 2 protein n=1 Tax=Nocardioides houyundeii TaxID=2045452 RepID=UPI001964C39E|nr:galactosyltransferase-related protein [Nocardioides houyundeii]